MDDYYDLLQKILSSGEKRGDRTGTGTFSRFGERMEFDLRKGFPAVTRKKLYFDSVVHELLWFLRGDSNIEYLRDNDVGIWGEWADEDGDVGPIYSVQWRSWPDYGGESIDQLQCVIENIREYPESRRHLVSAWNVGQLDEMSLPPCHVMFQFYVSQGKYLDCQLYQRSADMFIGIPFNIASYSLLTHMVAWVTDLAPRKFIHTIGDAHIYQNHTDQVTTMLERDSHPLPALWLRDVDEIGEFEREDIELVGYEHEPAISAPVATED